MADDIHADLDGTAVGGPDAVIVIVGVASAVALALAFTPPLAQGFNPVSAIPPGPDPQLAALLKPILAANSASGPAFDQTVSVLQQQPVVLANLVGFVPGSPSPRRTVTIFLRALSAGSQALSVAPT